MLCMCLRAQSSMHHVTPRLVLYQATAAFHAVVSNRTRLLLHGRPHAACIHPSLVGLLHGLSQSQSRIFQ